MKVFNYLNGIFYVLFGLYGTFLPKGMAEFMGWELSLLGFHEMRAVSLVMAVLGLMVCLYARKLSDQRPLTLLLIIVVLGFFAGRLLGVVLDGAGPVQTYQEMGFEAVIIALGAFLYKRGT